MSALLFTLSPTGGEDWGEGEIKPFATPSLSFPLNGEGISSVAQAFQPVEFWAVGRPYNPESRAICSMSEEVMARACFGRAARSGGPSLTSTRQPQRTG